LLFEVARSVSLLFEVARSVWTTWTLVSLEQYQYRPLTFLFLLSGKLPFLVQAAIVQAANLHLLLLLQIDSTM